MEAEEREEGDRVGVRPPRSEAYSVLALYS